MATLGYGMSALASTSFAVPMRAWLASLCALAVAVPALAPMRIAHSTAESRKMLPASSNSLRGKATQKFARIVHYACSRWRRNPRPHHFGRLRQPEIQHRRQGRIEAESLHRLPDQLPMLMRNLQPVETQSHTSSSLC